MTDLARVHLDYRVAFLGYLPRREEAALHSGYKLGRAAVADGLSLLDLVQVHHAVFLEVLEDSRDGELGQVAEAASEFLLEVLAPYDMTHRGLLPGS
ncbi:MAG: hypothetical protein AVDCRST_MAG32-2964 [uncultured Nocardioides sp.]|uniref:Phosphoserine phosphatase RsbU N-terminal domain-containing protein n=1 Tax=uncultured Nocardioides sp. TaxID=198441 RepID=A0A6J4NZQ1_9ACTN|nr:MAG: hypothetical protein AVDCRST_MAG32-2964 [uncultured Nocardioides sp.]